MVLTRAYACLYSLHVVTDRYLQQSNYLARTPAGISATRLIACRRYFFRVTAAHSVLSVLYFALVLVLRKDELHWSVFVLGMGQCTVLINGLLTAEMLLYM